MIVGREQPLEEELRIVNSRLVAGVLVGLLHTSIGTSLGASAAGTLDMLIRYDTAEGSFELVSVCCMQSTYRYPT